MSPSCRLCSIVTVAASLLMAAPAPAQSGQPLGKGFALERYEPSPAGEWSFWVDHPWYTKSKYFAAAGVTFDYSHRPLVYGMRTGDSFDKLTSIVAHQLVGHVDVAGSFLDRVTVSASLPVVFLERGTSAGGVSPNDSVVVGDPRFGIAVRLWGQPMRDPFSIHVAGNIWAPVGAEGHHAGDTGVRAMGKLIMGGLSHNILWSFTSGYLHRPNSRIGDFSVGSLPPTAGNSIGPEVQFGAALAYADMEKRFAVGPEAVFGTVVTHDHAFRRSFSSLEILLGGQYNIIKNIQIGLAGGIGTLREPGTPDFRFIFRLAYAPMHLPPKPLPPPPPPQDSDGDGVIDPDDLCPTVPMGPNPDPKRRGCPLKDTDSDGVFDNVDLCPTVPQGPHPDPKRRGCPDKDTDLDGFFDADDQCVTVPAGPRPDPTRPGCPKPDSDGDGIVDDEDACPNQPGVANPDAKTNGCPLAQVRVEKRKVEITTPVHFATNKDIILEESAPVLQAVADTLLLHPEIQRVVVAGHTDERGSNDWNRDLSRRRARNVVRWLIDHGVAKHRLEWHGYGRSRPIASNKTEEGRALNRRVEFNIVKMSEAPTEPAPAPARSALPKPPPVEEEVKVPGKPVPAPAPPQAPTK